MATLYITEFQAIGYAGGPTWAAGTNGPTQAAQQPAVANQTVAIGGASVASAAFNAATTLVRLHTDSICSIAFTLPGSTTDPVATATSARMAANQTEYFGVVPGTKVAVITNT